MLGCCGETSARRCLRRTREGVLERRVKWRNASCWANRGTVIRIWGSSLGDLERTGQSGHARAFRTLRGAVWGGQTCQGATRRRMSAVANYALRTHEGESQEQGASGAWLGRGAGLLLNLKRTVRTRLVRQCSTRPIACIRVAACHWPLRAHLYVPTTSERSSRQSTVRQTDIAYTVICTLFYKVQAFLLRFGSAFFEFVFDFDHFLITEDNAHNRVWLHSRSCGCIDPTSRALYKLPHHNSGGPANLGRVACSVTNLSLADSLYPRALRSGQGAQRR